MREIYIGVDGGGTKTKVTVEDGLGFELGSAVAGPGNIRSVEGAWMSVRAGIDEALSRAGIDVNDPNYRFYVGLGLAGTEIPEARAAFLKVPHPFHALVLDSDAYAACLGVHGNRDGAIIVVGTGVIGFQIERSVRSRVGGWGFPHADEGGGAWLGMEALRLAFKAIDGRCEHSPLIDEIFEKFDVRTSPAKLVSFANRAKPGDFGSIAPIVLKFLDARDPHAVRLVERAAEEIDLVTRALDRKRNSDDTRYGSPLPLCLLGGVSKFLTPFLAPEIQARLVERKFDAAKGAVFMVKAHMKAMKESHS